MGQCYLQALAGITLRCIPAYGLKNRRLGHGVALCGTDRTRKNWASGPVKHDGRALITQNIICLEVLQQTFFFEKFKQFGAFL